MFFAPIANVVLSAVRPDQEGKASGANNAIREVGGVFGVAVLASVFSAYGSYATPTTYMTGLVPAVWVGAAIVAVGAVVALAIPERLGMLTGTSLVEEVAVAAGGHLCGSGGAPDRVVPFVPRSSRPGRRPPPSTGPFHARRFDAQGTGGRPRSRVPDLDWPNSSGGSKSAASGRRSGPATALPFPADRNRGRFAGDAPAAPGSVPERRQGSPPRWGGWKRSDLGRPFRRPGLPDFTSDVTCNRRGCGSMFLTAVSGCRSGCSRSTSGRSGLPGRAQRAHDCGVGARPRSSSVT